MEQYNHIEYGRYLTGNMRLFASRPADSFFQSPNSDTLQAISNRLSEISYPVLVAVDGKDSDYADNGGEVLLEKPQYFFMILLPASNEDPTDIMAKQDEAKRNAQQIIARLMHDSSRYLKGLTGLLPESFVVRSIGPVGDCLYGVILGFNIEAGTSYKIDNEFWL